MDELASSLGALLALPRGQQPRALKELLAGLPAPLHREAWNTRFGKGSLFEAWTLSTVARGVYEANARIIRPLLDARPAWRIVEIGGGDGRLWLGTLRPGDVGELVIIDPAPEVHAQLASILPEGVRLSSVVAPVEQVSVPEADLIVCSLTLHHLAGASAAERAAVGLSGPGKLEVLRAMAQALVARSGLGLLNEADVYCDVGLAQGDPILVDRLFDSYIRRCAVAMLDDIQRREEASEDLRARWGAILRHWCLEQIAVADVSIAERDVYELDVPRWLTLLERAGLRVQQHAFSDDYGLFHQYVLGPAS